MGRTLKLHPGRPNSRAGLLLMVIAKTMLTVPDSGAETFATVENHLSDGGFIESAGRLKSTNED
ncbi:MAG: hypothetical protein CVU16_05580 [Betaproteobacteria bacterium HGW-Betaproteobacteria-10]|nr:MAG: hypothetical protein CVU16_05580 [Betaproteobacteria bacterium HGW-Betaproteobacteria-10]